MAAISGDVNPNEALTALAREGSTLYTMDAARQLRAVDVSGLDMVGRGSLALPAGGGQLFVTGGIAYAAAGLLYALATVLLAGVRVSIDPAFGAAYLLAPIAAVVIAGASLSGIFDPHLLIRTNSLRRCERCSPMNFSDPG